MAERTVVYLEDVINVIYQALRTPLPDYHKDPFHDSMDVAMAMAAEISPAQTKIIRCKDCIYQTESWNEVKYCEAHGDHIGKDYDYCSNARKKAEDDLIRRNDAKTLLRNRAEELRGVYGDIGGACSGAAKLMDTLPSVQSEQQCISESVEVKILDTRKIIYLDEAICAIKMLLEQSEDDEHDKIWNDALRGSINAIKHHVSPVQQEQNGWVHIDDIYRLISGHSNYHGDNILSALTCLAEGKEVPTPIDVLELPKRKGEWIDTVATPFTNNEGQLIHEKMCSKCKGIAYFRSVCGIMIADNVCPNCGADMRGEEG